MVWYKMEVDDLHAPEGLKAKLWRCYGGAPPGATPKPQLTPALAPVGPRRRKRPSASGRRGELAAVWRCVGILPGPGVMSAPSPAQLPPAGRHPVPPLPTRLPRAGHQQAMRWPPTPVDTSGSTPADLRQWRTTPLPVPADNAEDHLYTTCLPSRQRTTTRPYQQPNDTRVQGGPSSPASEYSRKYRDNPPSLNAGPESSYDVSWMPANRRAV